MLPVLSAGACAVLLLLSMVHSGMALGAVEPLELTGDFVPAISFSESHTDSVVRTLVSPGVYDYNVVPSRSTTASVTANIKGTVLAGIDGTTAFSLKFGSADIAFHLGDIPTYTKGQTTAFYCWNGWSSTKKALGTGGVKLTWTATKLTVTVTMGNEQTRPAAIGADLFVGDETTPGTFPIKDVLTAEVSFGSASTTVPRTVYFTGSYKVTHYRVGPADAPVYETDLYTVTETGAADYARPTVALTSPKQGASVGAAVDVHGTASDAKGLSGVEWTTSLNGGWTATDAFSISSSPADGLWGATSALWTVSLDSLPYGTTRLWVRSIDDSGNTSQPLLVTLVNPVPVVLTGRWDALLVPGSPNNAMYVSEEGALSFTFSGNGSFSGTLVQSSGTYPFTGSLTPDEKLVFTITRGTRQSLYVSGQIDSFSPASEGVASITCTIQEMGAFNMLETAATVTAFRSPWSAVKLAPASLAGRFHVKIDPVPTTVGDSYAVVTTARTGAASATFSMANGSVVTWSGVMGASGQLPIFTAKGVVSSPVTINSVDRTIGTTTVRWLYPLVFTTKGLKPPASNLGMFATLAASGIAYSAPLPATTRVMGLAATMLNATASWSGDNVSPALTQLFTVNASNTLTVPTNANALKLALIPSTGLWTGSFKIPGTSVLSACKMLIVGNQAYGHWTAPAPTGTTDKRYGVIHVQ